MLHTYTFMQLLLTSDIKRLSQLTKALREACQHLLESNKLDLYVFRPPHSIAFFDGNINFSFNKIILTYIKMLRICRMHYLILSSSVAI